MPFMRLAREGKDRNAFDLLRKKIYLIVGDELHAYAVGLIKCKMGWRWNLEEIEIILNGLPESCRSPLIISSDNTIDTNKTAAAYAETKAYVDNKLNDIANAGVKGFLEGHPFNSKEELDWFRSEVEDIKHPLLRQKFRKNF